jgi:hypothetical protein
MRVREVRWMANNSRQKERIETLEREKAELKKELQLSENSRIESLMKTISSSSTNTTTNSFKQLHQQQQQNDDAQPYENEEITDECNDFNSFEPMNERKQLQRHSLSSNYVTAGAPMTNVVIENKMHNYNNNNDHVMFMKRTQSLPNSSNSSSSSSIGISSSSSLQHQQQQQPLHKVVTPVTKQQPQQQQPLVSNSLESLKSSSSSSSTTKSPPQFSPPTQLPQNNHHQYQLQQQPQQQQQRQPNNSQTKSVKFSLERNSIEIIDYSTRRGGDEDEIELVEVCSSSKKGGGGGGVRLGSEGNSGEDDDDGDDEVVEYGVASLSGIDRKLRVTQTRVDQSHCDKLLEDGTSLTIFKNGTIKEIR